MNSNKSALIEALGRKGCAMAQYYVLFGETNDEDSACINLQTIDALWLNILKYVDGQDVKVNRFVNSEFNLLFDKFSLNNYSQGTYYFALWHAAAFSHFGRLAKLLLKLAEDKASVDVDYSLYWTFGKLNWDHCYQLYSNKLLVHYPASYQLF